MNLEEEYQRLVQSMYEQVSDDYAHRRLDREDAEALLKFIEEKTGIENKDGLPPWQNSSWCAY